jgi:endonuclease/exonuclease/phosphatase family metal-dependent hydrolase
MTLLRRPSAGRALASALALLVAACQASTDFLTAPQPIAATAPRYATVPAQGTATTLDVADWNIEWFGSPDFGPTNEALQQANVRDVIAGADVDVWGLEEVVSRAAWDTLIARLPGYAGVLANDPSVLNGPQYYSDFNNTEQKVAVLYKTSIATVKSAQIILTQNDYDFAGRPPMEVKLTVNVNGALEDLVVIVMHMKSGADAASWQRRQNAAVALKSYLDTIYPTQKVMVIGDWNDDVDTSILAGSPTPFANFVNDAARYTFPTKALSDAKIASTVNYPDFIDHQLGTNEQMADYVASSAHILRADQYIANYGTTTTDHYPVISQWTIPGGGVVTPAITVTSPNGGESWTVGSSHPITWTSANVANVKLEYSSDAGATWSTIAASLPASPASYAWTVPSTTTTSALVRVSDLASTTSDVSNATFSVTSVPTGPAKLIVNEIMANEPGSATAGEYVEIVNVGGTAQSIAGWTLSDATAVRHTFAAGTTLQPGKAIVVFGGASGIPAGTPNAIASSTGTLNLANGGDSVILKNGTTVVDSYTYAAALASQDGVSMNRKPDLTAGAAFVLHNTISTLKGSPGKKVDGTSF